MRPPAHPGEIQLNQTQRGDFFKVIGRAANGNKKKWYFGRDEISAKQQAYEKMRQWFLLTELAKLNVGESPEVRRRRMYHRNRARRHKPKPTNIDWSSESRGALNNSLQVHLNQLIDNWYLNFRRTHPNAPYFATLARDNALPSDIALYYRLQPLISAWDLCIDPLPEWANMLIGDPSVPSLPEGNSLESQPMRATRSILT